MIKFLGDLRELKLRIEECEVRGEWRYVTKSGQHQFRAEIGEHLNWWPTTGTITFQGGDIPVLQDRYELLYIPIEIRRAAIGQGENSSRRR